MTPEEHPLSRMIAEITAGLNWSIKYMRGDRGKGSADDDFYVEVTVISPDRTICCDCLNGRVTMFTISRHGLDWRSDGTVLDMATSDPGWQTAIRELFTKFRDESNGCLRTPAI